MQQKLHAAKAHSVFKYPLSPSTPPRPCLQASEKLHSPIGLLKIHVRTSLCGREMDSEPNILKRDGGAYPKSGGHSTLMPRLPALYLLLSPVCCSACSLSALYGPRRPTFPHLPSPDTRHTLTTLARRPAHPRPTPGPPRPTPARRPADFSDRPNLCFLFPAFASFLPLSRCIRVEFPELRAPPSRLSIFGSEAISRPQRLVRT